EQALERLNSIRRKAGQKEVKSEDRLTALCQKHADYLAANLLTRPELRPDEQVPGLPGYSDEGRDFARQTIVRMGGGSGPVDAIDWMLSSVLNRHRVLNPAMQSIGIASARLGPRGWVWVLHLPAMAADRATAPVLYPGPGQRDVPLYFGREVTSIVTDQPRETVAGFAISANFSPQSKIRSARGSLRDARGNEVPCWFSAPENPLPATGSYRQILLIPKRPLPPASVLAVGMEAEVDGKPWKQSWSFSTLDIEAFTAATAARLTDRLNQIRQGCGLAPVTLVPGLGKPCRLHAEYVARNIDHPAVEGLGIHEENPDLPGATQEGHTAGNNSVIAVLSDPLDSVDGWIATLYHRLPLLDPTLKKIGYGQFQHP
ncbi:MAG: CAP domain-containing protein, partial [Gemmataceae bacterium]